nr:uncharacterized mitochondrial protein AtMg00810-like [Tanacetum cinerariifolium]
MTDYSLWEVIINGDSPTPIVVVEGAVQPATILSTDLKLSRRNELKASGTLLMALPDKHQLKFNSHEDANTLMEAIEKRLQKLVSQLEIHGVSLSQEDVNLKFLRSLPSEWKTHTLIWRNKANLEEHSLDDLFNSLKIYETEVRNSSSPSNPTQNLAFVSSSNTDSTTDSVSAATSVSAVCAQLHVSSHPNIDSLSNAVIFSFFASQYTSPQLDNEDLKQIDVDDVDDLKEMDLRWSPKDTRRTGAAEPQRRHVSVETSTSNALVSQCNVIGSYDWSYQAEKEPANFAFMAISSSSSASNNEVKSCSKACLKVYNELHSQYDKLIVEYHKYQIDILLYQAGLESVEARLAVYKQNESILQENINMLKNEVEARDNVLITLKQKLNQAEKERDDLKLKFDKFQTSSKSLTELLAIQTNNKHGLGYYSESDSDSLSPSSHSDRNQSSSGYNVVPPPITGNFMPPKPDLVFHTTPIAVETTHSAFTDWVSNTKDEFEPNDPQNVPSFVKPTEHVKPSRHYNHPVKASILAATPILTSPKTNCSSKRKNRKTCFVYRSVDHLIKDCTFHAKPKTQPTPRNYAHRGYNKQNASFTKKYPQKHIVSVAVLTKSKPVSITAVRPVSVVSVVKGKKGKWVWRPKCPILDHDSKTTEMNGGYVAFGGNPKGGKNSDFKLPDESQVLLRVPRENNMYNVNLKDIVPSGDLTCLFSKAIINESNLWHKRLGHINFKTINKLVKGNLVKGLLKKVFENHNTYVACKKGKQHRASCKTKPVFLLATKDETSPTLKTFINGLENQLSLKVKVIRSDNGTEFKNSDFNQFCRMNGIKREFSVPRTPQQNGIAERKNRILIEATRTMLADLLLPILFWAKAVNTACYGKEGKMGKFEGKVDEGFLVGYSVNSKAFRVFNSRTRIVQETLHVNFLENKPNVVGTGPTWLFDIDSLTRTMNYQLVTAGNQTNPNAGFQETFNADKVGEEANQQYMIFPVWSTGSTNPQNKEGDAAFDEKEHDAEKHESVANSSPSSSALSGEQDDMTKKRNIGKSPIEYFTGHRDLNENFEDYSKDSSNDVSAAGPIVPTAGQNYSNSTNPISAAGPSNSNTSPTHGKSLLRDAYQPPNMVEREDSAYSDHENVGAKADFNNLETSIIEPKRVHQALKDPSWIEAIQEELLQFRMQKVWILVDLPLGKRAIGHTQEEEIDYEEVFAPVARIEAIRLFLAYSSFIGFMVYQMDVKSAFLYGTIEEEVKQKKDGIFINQDKYVAKILKKFRLTEGKSASTLIDTEKLLLKDPDGEDVDVHIYRSMIGSLMYLTSSRPDIMFAVCACARFQVTPKASHLHAVKRIFRYLKGKLNLGLWYLKDSPFDLVAYSDSDYAGASLDRKSTTGGCQFLRCRLISWQCKKQTVVATSSTEAEYVAGASCCTQVLWI